MTVALLLFILLVENHISESLGHRSIWQVCLENNAVDSALAHRPEVFRNVFRIVLVVETDRLRCKGLLLNADFTCICRVHLGSILVLAKDATVSELDSDHAILSNHHLGSSILVSFDSSWHMLHVLLNTISERSAFTQVVSNNPLQSLLVELCFDTVTEKNLCISVLQLSYDDTISRNNSAHFIMWSEILADRLLLVSLHDMAGSQVLDNQTIL